MEKCTYDADKYHVFFTRKAEQQGHGCKAENAAGEAVAKGYHLSCHHAGYENAHKEYTECILPSGIIEEPKRDDVGKAKLDAGDWSQRRQHGFYHKDGQCDSGIHGKKGHMLDFHG